MYKPGDANRSLSILALSSLQRIAENISREIYTFEECACFCGNSGGVLLAERDWYGNYYPFVLCKTCGIMRASPRLSEKAYADFYTHEYRTLYGDDDRNKEDIFQQKIKEGKEVYDFIAQHVKLSPQSTVFEVGCNMGYMLLPFHENGHDVLGVDYGAENIEYGRKKTGLRLEAGGVEKLKEHGKKADFILLSHVFEHFLDIGASLQSLRAVMKPGALVYIFVPGTFWFIENACGGNIMALLQNAHAWQFSLATLRYVMECSGFELACGDERAAAIFKYSDANLRSRADVPAGEYERVLAFMKDTERKYLPKYILINALETLGLKNYLRKLVK